MTSKTLSRDALFVVVYLLLDWVSYQHPQFGINVTPWNPEAALAIVYLQRFGPAALLPYCVALAAGEFVVRHLQLVNAIELLADLPYVFGYGALAEYLRRPHGGAQPFSGTRWILRWEAAVAVGAGISAVLYVAVMVAIGRVPRSGWFVASAMEWVAEATGIVVNMPFLWLLTSESGRARLGAILRSSETVGYCALALSIFALGIGGSLIIKLHLMYLLLLPVIWASARQGLAGAAFSAFAVQAGLIVEVARFADRLGNVYEVQILVASIALVGIFIGLVVDEQWRTMRKLKQTMHLAAAGELTAAIAHELLQPLTAIGAYGAACRTLAASGGDMDRLRGTLECIIRESNRASDVVRELREFFRTGSSNRESVEVTQLMADAAETFRARAVRDGVELGLTGNAGTTVFADRMHLTIVLRNLLANGFDAVASAPGGARRVSLSATRLAEGRVRIRVEDTGPGVSEHASARIFESFYSTKSSGLGLGLVMSRALVEAHGGRLWAEIGDHGVFNLELPVTAGEAHA